MASAQEEALLTPSSNDSLWPPTNARPSANEHNPIMHNNANEPVVADGEEGPSQSSSPSGGGVSSRFKMSGGGGGGFGGSMRKPTARRHDSSSEDSSASSSNSDSSSHSDSDGEEELLITSNGDDELQFASSPSAYHKKNNNNAINQGHKSNSNNNSNTAGELGGGAMALNDLLGDYVTAKSATALSRLNKQPASSPPQAPPNPTRPLLSNVAVVSSPHTSSAAGVASHAPSPASDQPHLNNSNTTSSVITNSNDTNTSNNAFALKRKKSLSSNHHTAAAAAALANNAKSVYSAYGCDNKVRTAKKGLMTEEQAVKLELQEEQDRLIGKLAANDRLVSAAAHQQAHAYAQRNHKIQSMMLSLDQQQNNNNNNGTLNRPFDTHEASSRGSSSAASVGMMAATLASGNHQNHGHNQHLGLTSPSSAVTGTSATVVQLTVPSPPTAPMPNGGNAIDTNVGGFGAWLTSPPVVASAIASASPSPLIRPYANGGAALLHVGGRHRRNSMLGLNPREQHAVATALLAGGGGGGNTPRSSIAAGTSPSSGTTPHQQSGANSVVNRPSPSTSVTSRHGGGHGQPPRTASVVVGIPQPPHLAAGGGGSAGPNADDDDAGNPLSRREDTTSYAPAVGEHSDAISSTNTPFGGASSVAAGHDEGPPHLMSPFPEASEDCSGGGGLPLPNQSFGAVSGGGVPNLSLFSAVHGGLESLSPTASGGAMGGGVAGGAQHRLGMYTPTAALPGAAGGLGGPSATSPSSATVTTPSLRSSNAPMVGGLFHVQQQLVRTQRQQQQQQLQQSGTSPSPSALHHPMPAADGSNANPSNERRSSSSTIYLGSATVVGGGFGGGSNGALPSHHHTHSTDDTNNNSMSQPFAGGGGGGGNAVLSPSSDSIVSPTAEDLIAGMDEDEAREDKELLTLFGEVHLSPFSPCPPPCMAGEGGPSQTPTSSVLTTTVSPSPSSAAAPSPVVETTLQKALRVKTVLERAREQYYEALIDPSFVSIRQQEKAKRKADRKKEQRQQRADFNSNNGLRCIGSDDDDGTEFDDERFYLNILRTRAHLLANAPQCDVRPAVRKPFYKTSLDFMYCELVTLPMETLGQTLAPPPLSTLLVMEEAYIESKAPGVLTSPTAGSDPSATTQALAAAGAQFPNFIFPSIASVLVDLNISNNRLEALPADIGMFSSLKRLTARNNRIRAVPPSLCMCEELVTLNLSNNLLESLPEELEELNNLETLVLDYNRFDHLPLCVFTGMAKLRKLCIIDNSALVRLHCVPMGGNKQLTNEEISKENAAVEAAEAKRRQNNNNSQPQSASAADLTPIRKEREQKAKSTEKEEESPADAIARWQAMRLTPKEVGKHQTASFEEARRVLATHIDQLGPQQPTPADDCHHQHQLSISGGGAAVVVSPHLTATTNTVAVPHLLLALAGTEGRGSPHPPPPPTTNAPLHALQMGSSGGQPCCSPSHDDGSSSHSPTRRRLADALFASSGDAGTFMNSNGSFGGVGPIGTGRSQATTVDSATGGGPASAMATSRSANNNTASRYAMTPQHNTMMTTSATVGPLIPPSLLKNLLQRPLAEPLFELELDNAPELLASYEQLRQLLVAKRVETPQRMILTAVAEDLVVERDGALPEVTLQASARHARAGTAAMAMPAAQPLPSLVEADGETAGTHTTNFPQHPQLALLRGSGSRAAAVLSPKNAPAAADTTADANAAVLFNHSPQHITHNGITNLSFHTTASLHESDVTGGAGGGGGGGREHSKSLLRSPSWAAGGGGGAVVANDAEQQPTSSPKQLPPMRLPHSQQHILGGASGATSPTGVRRRESAGTAAGIGIGGSGHASGAERALTPTPGHVSEGGAAGPNALAVAELPRRPSTSIGESHPAKNPSPAAFTPSLLHRDRSNINTNNNNNKMMGGSLTTTAGVEGGEGASCSTASYNASSSAYGGTATNASASVSAATPSTARTPATTLRPTIVLPSHGDSNHTNSNGGSSSQHIRVASQPPEEAMAGDDDQTPQQLMVMSSPHQHHARHHHYAHRNDSHSVQSIASISAGGGGAGDSAPLLLMGSSVTAIAAGGDNHGAPPLPVLSPALGPCAPCTDSNPDAPLIAFEAHHGDDEEDEGVNGDGGGRSVGERRSKQAGGGGGDLLSFVAKAPAMGAKALAASGNDYSLLLSNDNSPNNKSNQNNNNNTNFMLLSMNGIGNGGGGGALNGNASFMGHTMTFANGAYSYNFGASINIGNHNLMGINGGTCATAASAGGSNSYTAAAAGAQLGGAAYIHNNPLLGTSQQQQQPQLLDPDYFLSSLVRVNWNKTWPDDIMPSLCLGSLRTVQNLATLHALGITHVLSCGRNLDTPIEFLKVYADPIEKQQPSPSPPRAMGGGGGGGIVKSAMAGGGGGGKHVRISTVTPERPSAAAMMEAAEGAYDEASESPRSMGSSSTNLSTSTASPPTAAVAARRRRGNTVAAHKPSVLRVSVGGAGGGGGNSGLTSPTGLEQSLSMVGGSGVTSPPQPPSASPQQPLLSGAFANNNNMSGDFSNASSSSPSAPSSFVTVQPPPAASASMVSLAAAAMRCDQQPAAVGVAEEEEVERDHTGHPKIKQLVLEVDDNESEALSPYFMQAIDFIEDSARCGGKTLVHCFAGVSRSATVVVAYVMHKQSIGAKEALAFVQKKRPCANPNYNFRNQLVRFESHLKKKGPSPAATSAPTQQ